MRHLPAKPDEDTQPPPCVAASWGETTEEALEVLSETPSVTVETNPIKKVPDLNPVEKVNPFKTSNPFQ